MIPLYLSGIKTSVARADKAAVTHNSTIRGTLDVIFSVYQKSAFLLNSVKERGSQTSDFLLPRSSPLPLTAYLLALRSFGYDTDRPIVLEQRGSHLFNAGASGFAQSSH